MKRFLPSFLLGFLLLTGALVRPVRAQNPQLAVIQATVVGSTTDFSSTLLNIRQTVADAQGNTYSTGIFHGTVHFGAFSLTSISTAYDVFVVKRNATGTYAWAAQGGGTGDKQVTALAVDASGDIAVTGYFNSRTASFGSTTLTNSSPATASLSNDVFVAKLNSNGQSWQWAVGAGGGTRINGDDKGTAITVDALGSIYVAGTFNSSAVSFGPSLLITNPYPGFDNIFLGKLNASGTWLWVKGQDYMGLNAFGLSTDPAGNVYLTGAYGRGQVIFGPSTLTNRLSANGFIAKINSAGAWQWATGTRNGDYEYYPLINAVVADGRHSLYITGIFNSDSISLGSSLLTNSGAMSPPGPSGQTYRTNNAFVARLNAYTGTWQWVLQTTGVGDEGFGIPLLDGAGHVYVSGSFREPNFPSSTTPGNTFGPTTLYSAGKSDVVVAQLDTAGHWLWARQTGGAGSEGGVLCRVNAQGRGTLTGSFSTATASIGPYPLTAFSPVQSETAFAAELGSNGLLAVRLAAAPRFEVYPNPARTAVIVAGLPPGQAVLVLDLLGRLVLRGTVPPQGPLQLALPVGLPADVYLVRAAAQTQRLVVE